MLKKKIFTAPICLVLALLLVVDYAVFNPAPAKALDKKSLAIGAGVGIAAGAGAVIAAPVIGTALAAAGTGILGIGGAIIGGLAAAAGAVTGALVAVGGALAAAGAAVAGWVVGLIASPLFIPALIVIGIAVAGYLIYRHYKKKNASGKVAVLPENKDTIVTPGEYDMNPVIPPMNQSGGVQIGDEDGLVIPGTQVSVSSTPPTTGVSGNEPLIIQGEQPSTNAPTNLAEAEKRYKEAYKAYTKLVTTGGKGDVQGALKEYKAALDQYEALKKAAGSR